MNRRKQESGGQAIVMVTLALLAMTGIMGFAVDFGWSFFVKKSAQTVADAGAMAAVQEAYSRMDGQFFSATCPNTTGNLYCSATPTSCVGMSEATGGNLYNGCLYAATSTSGFCNASGAGVITCPTGASLTIEAALGGTSGTAPPSPLCPPGANCGTISKLNVPYWVQMTAKQSIPQLFSAVLGNKNAFVAASAVAGINGTQVPGNLVLLDRPGDCYTPPGGSLTCGNNINMTGFLLNSITAAGPIYMASTCNGTYTANICQLGGGTAGWAGKIGSFFSTVAANVIETPRPASGNTTTGNTWTCSGGASPCPSQVTQSSVFLDPTRGEAQPPLNVSLAVPSCGIKNAGGTATSAVITGSNSSASPLLLGPYNYYSYHLSGATKVYDGLPISITGNVYFTQSGGCNQAVGTAGLLGATGTSQSSNFDVYFFYGGMWISSFAANSAVKFDAGQYVMVGTSATSSNFSLTSCAGSGAIFCADDALGFAAGLVQSTSGSANGSTSGMMFIFTAPGSGYPGLSTQVNALTTAGITVSTAAPNYGSVNIQNLLSTTALTGVLPGGAGSSAPTSLSQYSGLLMWQDRGNSTVTYDSTGHVLNQNNTSQPPSGANGMNIFGLVGSTNVDGVIYQPEGAYLTSAGAGSGFNVSTQIVTGGIYLNGFIGVSVSLGTPTHLLSSYSPALIQ